jgi:K+-sensing histidine kinase KdpD
MNINLSSTIHDLKNSLARIMECSDQPSNEEIETIRNIARTACSTLTSLLQIEYLRENTLILNKEYLDVDSFMRDVYVDAKPYCKHPFHLTGATPEQLFMIDRLLITQVLINAVQNADRYTNTEISISYRLSNDGNLEIDVIDDGPGFPDSMIFGDNGKVDGGWNGIALGREIVSRHGGELCLHNKSGGVFSLKLSGLCCINSIKS